VKLDVNHLRSWIGREDEARDTIDPGRVAALAATLDLAEAPSGVLPPLWHWIFFNPVARARELGPDGHPRRGGFLPPVTLPRRMWAGGRLSFHADLPVGALVLRQSTIADVQIKQGRGGTLVFVTVRHRLIAAGALAIEEEHDIVYREAPDPKAAAPTTALAPADHAWSQEVRPDPVLLFRYSALTFNGHRIHYDRPYATGVEGHGGLVVHGPLLATLMAELARAHQPRRLARFDYRGHAPVIDTASFQVRGAPEGAGARLWIARADGALAMTAQAVFADA
jgi:3-methylfumaryl-CoA hydratase